LVAVRRARAAGHRAARARAGASAARGCASGTPPGGRPHHKFASGTPRGRQAAPQTGNLARRAGGGAAPRTCCSAAPPPAGRPARASGSRCTAAPRGPAARPPCAAAARASAPVPPVKTAFSPARAPHALQERAGPPARLARHQAGGLPGRPAGATEGRRAPRTPALLPWHQAGELRGSPAGAPAHRSCSSMPDGVMVASASRSICAMNLPSTVPPAKLSAAPVSWRQGRRRPSAGAARP